jgi:hypothetical protein
MWEVLVVVRRIQVIVVVYSGYGTSCPASLVKYHWPVVKDPSGIDRKYGSPDQVKSEAWSWEVLWNSMVRLFGRVSENLFTVGVKAKIEKPHVLHKLLSLVKLSVTSKESLDEFDTGILAEASLLALGSLKHGGFTGLEKRSELLSEAFTSLDELLNKVTVVIGANTTDGLFSTLHLTSKLNKEEPHLTSHIRDGSGRTLMVDGPVINPLSKTVGIKDTT